MPGREKRGVVRGDRQKRAVEADERALARKRRAEHEILGRRIDDARPLLDADGTEPRNGRDIIFVGDNRLDPDGNRHGKGSLARLPRRPMVDIHKTLFGTCLNGKQPKRNKNRRGNLHFRHYRRIGETDTFLYLVE